MSFDLFLQRFETGSSAQADRSAILKVLRNSCDGSADSFGFYNIEFHDGSSVEFSAKGLELDDSFTDCSFHIRGISPEIISFVFAVSVAGDMVIFNVHGADEPTNPIAILSSESQLIHLPEDAAINPVVCDSASHLSKLLGLGYDKWDEYRDSITNREKE